MGIGGGEGDRIRSHKSAVGHISIGAVGSQTDRAVPGCRSGTVGQTGTVGHAPTAGDGGLRRPGSAGGIVGQDHAIGHHDLGGGAGHHAMAVGGGKGHRIGAGIAGVRNVAIGAVRSQTDRAMCGTGLGGRGQTGAVGDADGAGNGLQAGPSPVAGAVGQGVCHRHMGGGRADIAFGIRGGKGNGVGADESTGRSVGIMAAPIDADRATIGRRGNRAMG